MPRIVLIHQKLEEGEARAAALRALGYEVRTLIPASGAELRALRPDPPEGFVIALDRVPSRAQQIAVFLRQQKATRPVPLVFAGGEAEKVAKLRPHFPDAPFVGWDRLDAALKKALRQKTVAPFVPRTEDLFKDTPLGRKLGLAAGCSVALLDAPDDFAERLEHMEPEISILPGARGKPNVIFVFGLTREAMEWRVPDVVKATRGGSKLWLAWPKRTSRLKTDLAPAVLRDICNAFDLVDYKMVSLDSTWSAMLFAARR